MKIALIWDADYPWDVRIEKVAKSLVDKGHEVHLVCRNTRREPELESIDSITVHRLQILSENSHGLNSILSFPAFFNPVWLRRMRQVFEEFGIEYVIVRDLPLCPAAIWVSRRFGIPCVMDMAECYPELLRCIWKFEKFRVVNLFVRNPVFADVVERYCLKNLSKIFVMIEESRDRLIGMGVPPSKIEIVSNTPPSSLVSSLSKPKKDTSGLSLLYLGILNPSRGLDTVLQGMACLKRSGVACSLKIAGTGKSSEELKSLALHLGISDSVEFLGWVDRKDIAELFLDTDIGVVPHHVCEHWNSTIPNKLFDYMAAGVPVLSSNVLPMTRIITEQKCGAIYTDGDPESFAASVIRLQDDHLRSEMGLNGRQAVVTSYNWEADSERLMKAIAPAV